MADRYFVSGGVDNYWNTSGNWSLTSGGSGGAGVPTNADTVYFDENSPSTCSVDVDAQALHINFGDIDITLGAYSITSTTYTVNLADFTINNGATAITVSLGTDETADIVGFNTISVDASSTGVIQFSYGFYTANLNLNPGNSLKFAAGQTFAVTNAPTWTGTGANKIVLRSTSNGSEWYINDTFYDAIIETGSAPDTITETGSATDTITEVGNV